MFWWKHFFINHVGAKGLDLFFWKKNSWTVRSGCCRHWADFLCSAGNAAAPQFLCRLSSCPDCCCLRMIGAASLHTLPHQASPSVCVCQGCLLPSSGRFCTSQDYCNLPSHAARMPTLKTINHILKLAAPGQAGLIAFAIQKSVYSGVSWHHLTRSGVAVQVCSLYKWSFVGVAVRELTLCFSSASQHSYPL